MRVLLAPAATSNDRSISTPYTESLQPPQIHSHYKCIYSISYQNTLHPTTKLISIHSFKSFSFLYIKVSIDDGMIIEIVGYHPAIRSISSIFHKHI